MYKALTYGRYHCGRMGQNLNRGTVLHLLGKLLISVAGPTRLFCTYCILFQELRRIPHVGFAAEKILPFPLC